MTTRKSPRRHQAVSTIHVYVRISPVDKGDNGQEERCRAAATLRGVRDPRVWRDEGVSGSVPLIKRPQGDKMLATVQPGDIIIANRLDRLFSIASDGLIAVEHLRRTGVDIVVLELGSEPVTQYNWEGQMFVAMLAAFANLERAQLHEKIVEGMRKRRALGGLIGVTPYGWRMVSRNNYEPVESELWLIHRARVLHAAGKNQHQIADILNEAGYRTRQGTKFRQRQIGRWLERPAVPEEATAKQPPPAKQDHA